MCLPLTRDFSMCNLRYEFLKVHLQRILCFVFFFLFKLHLIIAYAVLETLKDSRKMSVF